MDVCIYIQHIFYYLYIIYNIYFRRYCRKVLQFLKGRRNKFFLQEYTVFPPTIAETNPCIN